ncbi:MAG TPA: hypothetical protein VNF07_12815 [Acidimicrobiales bacterium]|nr:hypothetical protein [Acidimicrobiales bacterium]
MGDPTKQWKIQRSDFAERERWEDYRAAFEEMLQRTSTERAPWYLIPADHKWYRNWVVSNILIGVLGGLDPQYPAQRPGVVQGRE